MSEWRSIVEDNPPVGETVLICNERAGVTAVGYSEWSDRVPFPIWIALDNDGFGRFVPTHWMPLPEAKR